MKWSSAVNSTLKKAAATAAALLFIGSSTSTALADGQSSWKTETANGTTYKFCSSISSESSKVKASVIIKASSATNVEKAMRGKPRMYHANKTIALEGTWHSSIKGSTKLTASTPLIAKKGKSYLSRALVQLYNGHGYDEHSAKWSPASKKAPARGHISTFPMTIFRGKVMTYGSDFDCDGPSDSPDLVAAVAANGSEGYVLSREINSAPETPAEALTDDINTATRPTIVYSLAGEPLGVLPVG